MGFFVTFCARMGGFLVQNGVFFWYSPPLSGPLLCPGVLPFGRTQVKERSTHARPGTHMQRSLTVPSISIDKYWLSVHGLAMLCQPQPLASILHTLAFFSLEGGGVFSSTIRGPMRGPPGVGGGLVRYLQEKKTIHTRTSISNPPFKMKKPPHPTLKPPKSVRRSPRPGTNPPPHLKVFQTNSGP